MRPLFITNTARGGSNLVCQILSANADVTVASDPYLEVFRSMRNSLLLHAGYNGKFANKLNETPFLHYYYDNEGKQIIDLIQNANCDVEISEDEWKRIYEIQLRRLELECAELIPLFHKTKSKTYNGMIYNLMEQIKTARSLPHQKWIGMKDPWIIELFFPLLRSFDDAKFIVVFRDPRASIASNLLVQNKSMIAHVASFARAWRKNVAFSLYLRQQEEFKNKLYFVSYEKLLSNPEDEVQKICSFLEIKFSKSMLDTTNFIDYSTGKVWIGNSSYEEKTHGISPHRIDRWMETLNVNAKSAIEYICGNELRFIERKRSINPKEPKLSSNALEFFIEDNEGFKNWRTDSGFAEKEFGFEAARNNLLSVNNSLIDKKTIKKFFLFEEVFEELSYTDTDSLFG